MRLDRVYELLDEDLRRVAESWEGQEEELKKLPPQQLIRLNEYGSLVTYLCATADKFKWFDLGTITKEEMHDISEDFVNSEGVVDKSIQLPFDKTVFTIKIAGARTAFVDVNTSDSSLTPTHESEDIHFVMMCEQMPEDRIMLSVTAYMEKNGKANCPARPTIMHKIQREDGLYMWGAFVASIDSEPSPYDEVDSRYARQCVPVFDYALNLLACDNVVIKKEEAPEKLNKKRKKAGAKYMIPERRTIHIEVEGCEVFRYGETKGSHASPTVHLRRGHIRRLGENKTTWVRSCVVGKKGKIAEKVYKVEA